MLLEETRNERAAQLRHFDSLDAKAGIVLGFAGAIVALSPTGRIMLGLGRIAAVAAGTLALWAFFPREIQAVDVHALRRDYLTAEPQFTKLALLDSQVAMVRAGRDLLESKARRLKASLGVLATGILLFAAGLPLH